MAPPIPGAPLVAASGYNSAALSWKKVGSGNIVYSVFRNAAQVGTTKDNDFSDTGLADGGSYTYTVAATDQSGTSAQSPSTSVILGKQILARLDNGLLLVGPGDPTNSVIASPPTLWLRTDGGAGTTLYVKETGVNTSTGWAAK